MKEIQINKLKEPSFWEEAWSLDREKSLFRRDRKTLQEQVEFWNKRAESFQKSVMSEQGEKRVKRVLDWLEKQGVDFSDIEVLDVGAGPGAFSLALADRCKAVVALEPSEAMVGFLHSEIAKRGCNNIQVIQKAWEEVDIIQEGLANRFELVFASMSPGINNLITINKALECSKEYFYYSSFAGLRESNTLKKLWPALYGGDIPAWPDQVIFAFNLLYTLGLEIKCAVWEDRKSTELSMTEAISSLQDELRKYGKELSDDENKLQELIKANMVDGVILEQTRIRLGQILARKNDRP